MRLIPFAREFKWTPAQVWALEYGQFYGFAKYLDALAEERKKQSQQTRRMGRRRRSG